MNKKIIIIGIIVFIVIIVVVLIFKPQENTTKNTLEGNQITKEKFNDNLIENVEEKLSSAGIEVMKGVPARFKELEGNEYLVMENGEETEKTFEMYPINIREKIQLLGEDVSDGKVTIDGKTEGILSSSVLIINFSDEGLKNQIMQALDL